MFQIVIRTWRYVYVFDIPGEDDNVAAFKAALREPNADDFVTVFPLNVGNDMRSLENRGSLVIPERRTCMLLWPEDVKYLYSSVYADEKPHGNHRHFRKVEYTTVLSGECVLEYWLYSDQVKHQLVVKPGMIVRILPGIWHTLTKASRSPEAIVIEASPQVFDSADGYTYESNIRT